MLSSCSGNNNPAEEKPHNETADSTIDTAAIAEAQRIADEQARQDSIIKVALKGDSLVEKHIVVDKESCTLYVREDGNTLMSAPVCLGMGVGQKRWRGDHKTPEGEYKIITIENASSWTHDFHDGEGKRRGAYGPWFFRLNTPQSPHIGIHGSPFPESMGKRESDGCIRLRNEDLEQLKEFVKIGMKVIINPDKLESQDPHQKY